MPGWDGLILSWLSPGWGPALPGCPKGTFLQRSLMALGLGWTCGCEWPKVTHEGLPWPHRAGLDPQVWMAKSDLHMGSLLVRLAWAGMDWAGPMGCEWPKVTHEDPPWPHRNGLGWAGPSGVEGQK